MCNINNNKRGIKWSGLSAVPHAINQANNITLNQKKHHTSAHHAILSGTLKPIDKTTT